MSSKCDEGANDGNALAPERPLEEGVGEAEAAGGVGARVAEDRRVVVRVQDPHSDLSKGPSSQVERWEGGRNGRVRG